MSIKDYLEAVSAAKILAESLRKKQNEDIMNYENNLNM